MDSQQKTQVSERLKQANNILVTVSANPSVDQLAGAVGLTLLLNKLGKHATAVFSGKIPSTLEFLQPEKTLEKNTDSLRDFIIALDKSKADKLRYKVEDQMVKIFITPYRTSLSDKDLEFSQGDFNVEVVIALGVKQQQDLDQAITSHGRILHDATVIGLNTQAGPAIGTVEWVNPSASSLCEMLVDLGLTLRTDILDNQMATAFLTGIVAETNRFSNEKTSSETMQMSAKLMAAGANQQLIASQLQPPSKPAPVKPTPVEEEDAELPPIDEKPSPAKAAKPPKPEEPKENDGSLQIDHGGVKLPEVDLSVATEESAKAAVEQIDIDEQGQLKSKADAEAAHQKEAEAPPEEATDSLASPHLILKPPTLGGRLTANSEPEGLDPSTDPLGSTPLQQPLLTHDNPKDKPSGDTLLPSPAAQTATQPAVEDIIGSVSTADEAPIPPIAPPPDQSPNTLSDLEKVVDSPHLDQPQAPIGLPPAEPPAAHLDTARDAVSEAVKSSTPHMLEPVQSLNAQPMDLNLGNPPVVSTPPSLVPPDPGLPADSTAASVQDPTAPPPVPPPMMPPVMPPSDNVDNPNNTAL